LGKLSIFLLIPNQPKNGFVADSVNTIFVSFRQCKVTVWRSKTEESNRFQYDYFVKDHLGNVRMVLAEEVYPIASMEGDLSQGSSPVSVSKLFYDMEDSKLVLNPNTSLSYANNNGSILTR